MNRFVKYEFVAGLWPPNSSYEQTNIFLYACAAATIAAIIFSKGAPYRRPLYTNGMGPTKNYIVLLLEGPNSQSYGIYENIYFFLWLRGSVVQLILFVGGFFLPRILWYGNIIYQFQNLFFQNIDCLYYKSTTYI